MCLQANYAIASLRLGFPIQASTNGLPTFVLYLPRTTFSTVCRDNEFLKCNPTGST